MVDYGRDVDLGKIRDVQDVAVKSDAPVVEAIARVVDTLLNVVEKQQEAQKALSLILGQEIEAEES